MWCSILMGWGGVRACDCDCVIVHSNAHFRDTDSAAVRLQELRSHGYVCCARRCHFQSGGRRLVEQHPSAHRRVKVFVQLCACECACAGRFSFRLYTLARCRECVSFIIYD